MLLVNYIFFIDKANNIRFKFIINNLNKIYFLFMIVFLLQLNFD